MMRRQMLKMGALAATSLLSPLRARAQAPQLPARQARSPRRRATSVPARRRPPTSWIPTSSSSIPQFASLVQANTPIKRLWTGALWSEGPAWSGQGRYLVWSDIPNNRQLRWSEDDDRVSVFRIRGEQQQRQHVRSAGPADLVRAPDAARGALRARRLDHDPVRHVSTASASTRRTTWRRIPMAATGSPIRRTAVSCTKDKSTKREGRPIRPAGSIRGWGNRRKPDA